MCAHNPQRGSADAITPVVHRSFGEQWTARVSALRLHEHALSRIAHWLRFKVSCKVIALFLPTDRALKDCFEFTCRSWRLGNPPEMVTQLHFQSPHQAKYSQATTMAARCRQTGRRRHTGSRPVSVLQAEGSSHLRSPLEIDFHSRCGSRFPFASNSRHKAFDKFSCYPCKL